MILDLLATVLVVVVERCLSAEGFDELEASLSTLVSRIRERWEAHIEVARTAGRYDLVARPWETVSGVARILKPYINSQSCTLNSHAASCCASAVDEHPLSVPRAAGPRKWHLKVLVEG